MKFLRNLLLILLVLSMCLGMFSCANVKDADDSSQPVSQETAVPTLSFLDYAVVRATNVPEALVDEVTDMHAKLVALSGAANALSTDSDTAADSNAKEILVGNTNRPETAEVYAQLAGNEYVVAVIDNKVVIVGTNERYTSEALAHFVETYLADGATGEIASNLFDKGTGSTAVIVNSGKPAMTLVRNEYADKTELDQAMSIYNAIKDATGVEIPFTTDYIDVGQEYDDSTFEIIFGNTQYAQTELMKTIISPGEYGIEFVGNKIVIYSGSIEGMDTVTRAFCNLMEESVQTEFDGTVSLYLDKELISGFINSNPYFVDIPVKAGDRSYDSVYEAYDSTLMLYWERANEAMMDSYATELEAMGYGVHQSLDNDNIYSITYKRDNAMVHIYYLKRVKEFRVVTQGEAQFAPNPSSYTKVCDVAVTQIALHTGTGMCYLIRLEDGTFVVIDGNNIPANTAEGRLKHTWEVLYDTMVEQKPDSVDNIVISAWFLTHGHGDHYGMLSRYLGDYNGKVTLKMLVGNDASNRLYKNNGWARFDYNQAKGKLGGAVVKKAHTGEQFFFPGFTMTMLCTHEDLYPTNPGRHNNLSTVFDGVIEKEIYGSSVQDGKTRFIWLGDAESVVAAKLCKVYSGTLKTDVMQVAHHGNANGGSYELYATCNPIVAFVPATEYVFVTQWGHASQNKYLVATCEVVHRQDQGNYTIQ